MVSARVRLRRRQVHLFPAVAPAPLCPMMNLRTGMIYGSPTDSRGEARKVDDDDGDDSLSREGEGGVPSGPG